MALDPKARSRARLASVRSRSASRVDRRDRVRPARRAARRVGSNRRGPPRRSGSAHRRDRRARRVRLPAGAAGGAAGGAGRAADQRARRRRFAGGDETGRATGTAAAAQSRSRRAAADLSRRGQGAHRRRARRRDRLCRAAGLVLVEPFLRLGRQDPCARCPAPTSARRSARTCSAASPTCCWPSRAIRRCCSISTTRARSARTRSPASTADAGLNENLAREILELHTLGVRTGYTQDDVTRFANVLTGWTFVPLGDDPSTAASSPSIRGCTSPARRP